MERGLEGKTERRKKGKAREEKGEGMPQLGSTDRPMEEGEGEKGKKEPGGCWVAA